MQSRGRRWSRRRDQLLNAVTVLSLAMPCPAQAFGQAQLGGFVEYDNITYFKNPDEQKVNGRNQGILQLELHYAPGATAEAFGAVEVRADQADPTRNRVFLDEAYLALYVGAVDLRLGLQTYAWGRADAFNPTDNLTIWDYSDILDTDDEEIGAVSARVDYYFDDWTLEGVLIPSFTPSVLPDTNSRWWPDLPPSIRNPAFPTQGNPTLPAAYRHAEPMLPDEGTESWQYALKLSGSSRGWDFSVSWFDGFDDLPAVHSTTAVDSAFTSALITLQRGYHRRRAVGTDFATVLSRIGLHGEAAYYVTDDWDGSDPEVDDPYLQYVLGVDYTAPDVLPDKDLFVLLEWIQEVQIPDRNATYGITDLNHVLRKSVASKVELGLGTFATLMLKGVWNIYAGDWWVQPGFDWSVADGVRVSAVLDLLGGPDDSFFGTFGDNGRFQVRAKYSF